MKRFSFKLQKLLEFRQTTEERLITELAAIDAEYQRQTRRLMEIKSQEQSCRESLKEKLGLGNCEEIKETSLYLIELGERVKAQKHLILKIEESRRAKMEEILQASKERKALEQLKDQKRVEHRKETEREEQVFLDDIASTRHNRTAAAGFSSGS